MYTTGNTTNSVLSLSPELIKELAEYAVKEHRAGRCLTQEQVEKSVMETMGWSSPSCHEQEVVVSDCFIQMADAELECGMKEHLMKNVSKASGISMSVLHTN